MRWAVALLGTGFLIAALGPHTPVFQWLYSVFPPARAFRHPAILRDFWFVSLTLLAMVGARDLRAMLRMAAGRAAMTTVCAGIILMAALGVGEWLWMGRFPLPAGYRMPAAVQLALPAALMAFAAAARRSRVSTVLGLILLVAVVDGFVTIKVRFLDSAFLTDPQRIAHWRTLDEQRRSVLDLMDLERGDEINAENLGLIARRPMVRGYSPVPFKVDAMRRLYPEERLPDLKQVMAFAAGPGRIWFAAEGLVSLRSHEDYRASVARLPDVPLLIHSQASMLRTIDAGETAGIADAATLESIAAQLVRYAPREMVLRVRAPQSGWVLITDRWARSWRASVNGQETELAGANFMFRAVRVPAGESTILMRYELQWLWPIVAASWSVFAVATGTGVAPWIRRRLVGTRS